MIYICAWCRKYISTDRGEGDAISHGICTDCAEREWASYMGLLHQWQEEQLAQSRRQSDSH